MPEQQEHIGFRDLIMKEVQRFNKEQLRPFRRLKNVTNNRKSWATFVFAQILIEAKAKEPDAVSIRAQLSALKSRMEQISAGTLSIAG